MLSDAKGALKKEMIIMCTDCGGEFEVPEDVETGEIIECPDCGLDYVIVLDESGQLSLKELTLEGEDWGE